MGRLVSTALATTLLAACTSTNPLQGNWIVDLDATFRGAESAGFPEPLFGKRIRETYEGGTLQIDEDRVTLGLEGFNEVITHNYTVLATEGSCTRLRIAPENREHRYCVEGDRLTTYDPDSAIAIIFTRK